MIRSKNRIYGGWLIAMITLVDARKDTQADMVEYLLIAVI